MEERFLASNAFPTKQEMGLGCAQVGRAKVG
jgi:hypothetical protein